MARKLRSSFFVKVRTIGLGLVVSILLTIQCLMSTSASAWERTPFDPVFSPATGPGQEQIAIPLEPRFNKTFIRRQSASVAEGMGDETPVDQTGFPSADNPPNPSSGPSGKKTLSGEGFLTDLFRLFGFRSEDDAVSGEQVQETASVDRQPDIIVPPSKPVIATETGESPINGPERPTVEAVPEAKAGTQPVSQQQHVAAPPDAPGLFQKVVVWFKENTRRAEIPEDARRGVRSVVIDLPPAGVAERSLSDEQSRPQENNADSGPKQPAQTVQPPSPAPLLSAGNALPTIERKAPDLNLFDLVASFFSGDAVLRSSGRNRSASPPPPPTGEATPVAVERVVAVEQPPAEPAPAPELPSTPLVDAALAEATQFYADPADDTAFAIDIVVPVSDQASLMEEKLVLGEEGRLGRALPFGDAPGDHCIRRLSGRTWICLESLGWPAVISDAFMARGVPRGRTKVIVRYDRDEATQYRVSFPTESFDRIRLHLEYLLGPPSERQTEMVSMIAEPKLRNHVIRWIAGTVDDRPQAILEIREIDDIRWMEAPDKSNGVVRLYRTGAKPIFSMIMSADLQLIEVRQLALRNKAVAAGSAP